MSFALVVVTLTACGSLARFGYGHASTALAFYLDHYLDLDSAQKALVRDGLTKTFAWHRQHEIPSYVEALARLQEKITRGDIAPGDVETFGTSVAGTADRTIAHAAPMLATLASSLRPEQVAYLTRRLDRANADFRKEWQEGSVAKQRDKRYEKALEQFERWFGQLDESQRSLLRDRIDHLNVDYAKPPQLQARYAERLRRQTELLALISQLQANPVAPEEAVRLAHGFVERFDLPGAPERIAYERRARAQGAALVADVIRSTTSDQRRTAVERIQSWIDDFRKIAARDA